MEGPRLINAVVSSIVLGVILPFTTSSRLCLQHRALRRSRLWKGGTQSNEIKRAVVYMYEDVDVWTGRVCAIVYKACFTVQHSVVLQRTTFYIKESECENICER